MDPVEPYLELARTFDARAFAERVPPAFLVKRPRAACAGEAHAIEFRTAHVRRKPFAPGVEGDEFARAWLVVPVAKRPGNPFPDRVSIGRATNCDVVLRVAYVSKLHAHLLVEPGAPMRVVDLRSANGTWVNRRELSPGETCEVAIGDTLCFGRAELDLLDAERVHGLLRELDVQR